MPSILFYFCHMTIWFDCMPYWHRLALALCKRFFYIDVDYFELNIDFLEFIGFFDGIFEWLFERKKIDWHYSESENKNWLIYFCFLIHEWINFHSNNLDRRSKEKRNVCKSKNTPGKIRWNNGTTIGSGNNCYPC